MRVLLPHPHQLWKQPLCRRGGCVPRDGVQAHSVHPRCGQRWWWWQRWVLCCCMPTPHSVTSSGIIIARQRSPQPVNWCRTMEIMEKSDEIEYYHLYGQLSGVKTCQDRKKEGQRSVWPVN